MEHPLKRPLFVEFYGLPGCGKSTVSHLVASKLRDVGFLVYEPSYEIDRNCSPFIRKLKKLSIYLSWLVFHNNTFKKVSAIVAKNGYTGFAKIEQTSNVLQKISEYQKRGPNRVAIWDQGLLQASVSLSLKGEINADENLTGLQDILGSNVEILSVLISVEEKVALERMSQRTTNDSRVEKLKDANQKHVMLQRFQDGIDSISKQNKSLVVNGAAPIDNQFEQITKEIISNCVQ